ncbi:glycosyltransferase [uncultured Microbacterium sp.]|uniref:glycosyltransferase n=1 Tax=uncultured Microbacterium sp. TaxID=191216 RepID=UPI0028D2132E|nr:glycosyltransferase [uncultured Microbacterium sp.]
MSDRHDSPIDTLSAVIVHHRRHDTIRGIIDGLLTRGVDATRIVVVDNSDLPAKVDQLRTDLPTGVQLEVMRNLGYGAAVNVGLRALRDAGKEAPFTLVATHEVRVDEGCLHRLVAALQDPSLSAVGPELLTDHNRVWSMGGILSPVLRLPIHRRSIPITAAHAEPVSCDWLDGAIVVYRTRDLPLRPFDESYFLYTEEVDLHLRLGYAGGRIAVVASARAWQQSDGTPPFYFARNLRLLNSRHAGILGRTLGSALPILRRLAGLIARRRWSSARELWRGARTRLPQSDARVLLINPLGSALRHYVLEARQVLEASGVSTDSIQFLEPSANGGGRVLWIVEYIRKLHLARRLSRSMRSSQTVVCWPVLGLFDSLLIRIVAGKGSLVMHDPKPLVRAVGYGRLGAIVARTLAGRVKLVTHSRHAHRALARATGLASDRIELVPHPILTRAESGDRSGSALVSVMGQYKPDRDVALLANIAAKADQSWRLGVVGRGWPNIAGWTVEARFITEGEFENRLQESSVVLIPYRRFYQSGVAIRALEVGTPVVGPRDSVLSDVLGESSEWLTDDSVSSWLNSISIAVASTPSDVARARDSYIVGAVTGWARLAKEVRNG